MATRLINRLSVQRDFSVATRREETFTSTSSGKDYSEDDQTRVSVFGSRTIARRAASMTHKAVPLAHKAATLAHKAVDIGNAQQAASVSERSRVGPSTILESLEVRARCGISEEEPPRRKSPRDVFLPKALQDDHLWQSEITDHGWLESPDQASSLSAQGHTSRGSNEKGPLLV